MKQRPILFSTPMVQAIMEGRKTMTRRACKRQPGEHFQYSKYKDGTFNINGPDFDSNDIVCPYGQPGDMLYVKETFYAYGKWVKNGKTKGGIQKYKFEDLTIERGHEYLYEDCAPQKTLSLGLAKTDGIVGWFKRPSLFMKKDAARIWLRITNTRVEPIQDITEDNATAEGVEEIHPAPFVIRWKNYLDEGLLDSLKWSFYSLWCKINGVASWRLNPWVWVVEFERIEKPQEA